MNLNRPFFLYGCLIGLFLFMGILFRLMILEFSPQLADGMMAYLMGNHILTFGEYPQEGWMGTYQVRLHSSLYYYVIASFLTVLNSPQFLSLVTIFFQVGAVCMMWFVGIVLFGFYEGTGVLLVLLFSKLSQVQSNDIIWAPTVMQFFLWASIGTLAVSFKRRSTWFVVVSLGLFFFSGLVYIPAFLLFPAFLVAVWTVLKGKPRWLSISLATCAGLFIIGNRHRELFVVIRQALPLDLLDIWRSSIQSIQLILSSGTSIPFTPLSIVFFGSAMSIGWFGYVHDSSVKKEKKVALTLLGASVLTLLVIGSMLGLHSFPGALRYYTPVLGMATMVVVVFFFWLAGHVQRGRVVLIVILGAWSLMGFINGLRVYKMHLFSFFDPRLYASKLNSPLPWVWPMQKVLQEAYEEEGYTNYAFFSIDVIGGDTYWTDAVYWAPLENVLDEQLVRLAKGSNKGYEQIATGAPYRFVVVYTDCQSGDCRLRKQAAIDSLAYPRVVFKDSQITIWFGSNNL